jgi:hypothetical protein
MDMAYGEIAGNNIDNLIEDINDDDLLANI